MNNDPSTESSAVTEQVSNPPKDAETTVHSKPTLQDMDGAKLVPVNWIQPNPHQIRKEIGDEDIAELASSVKEVGLLEPLLVVPKGKKRFVLVAGHRRLEAARRAGVSNVPCVIREMDEKEFLLCSLTENLQRTDLTPFEEALSIKQLIDTLGLSFRNAARKIGKSHSFVGDRMALFDLPEDIKAAVSSGNLSLKKALAISKISLARVREKVLKKGSGLDTEAFTELVEAQIAGLGKKRKPYEKWDIPPKLKDFAKDNDSVRLFKGRISLRYESEDALRGLLTKLLTLIAVEEEDERRDEEL